MRPVISSCLTQRSGKAEDWHNPPINCSISAPLILLPLGPSHRLEVWRSFALAASTTCSMLSSACLCRSCITPMSDPGADGDASSCMSGLGLESDMAY
jgi:hypothetical protein